MNKDSFKSPILYQWPPANGVESIYPRCVVIHRMLTYLRRFPVAEQNESEFHLILMANLKTLEEKLEGKKFISDKDHPDLCDFTAFMVVQGLLAPEIEERDIVLVNYPNLKRWALHLDTITSGLHSRSLQV